MMSYASARDVDAKEIANDASGIVVVESAVDTNESVIVVETVVGEDEDNGGDVFEAVFDAIGANPRPPSKSSNTDGMDEALDDIIAEYAGISPGLFNDKEFDDFGDDKSIDGALDEGVGQPRLQIKRGRSEEQLLNGAEWNDEGGIQLLKKSSVSCKCNCKNSPLLDRWQRV